MDSVTEKVSFEALKSKFLSGACCLQIFRRKRFLLRIDHFQYSLDPISDPLLWQHLRKQHKITSTWAWTFKRQQLRLFIHYTGNCTKSFRYLGGFFLKSTKQAKIQSVTNIIHWLKEKVFISRSENQVINCARFIQMFRQFRFLPPIENLQTPVLTLHNPRLWHHPRKNTNNSFIIRLEYNRFEDRATSIPSSILYPR